MPSPLWAPYKVIYVMLRTWSGTLNFSIAPMDDFKIVLGMEFFDQIHAFPLLAINYLRIFDKRKACTIPVECVKSKKKMLSAMQFKNPFKKEPCFLGSI